MSTLELVRRVADCVLSGPGHLDASLRQAAAAGGPVPEPLAAFVDKVRRHAYRVTDEDIEALHRAGYSDDQIFEAAVSAAVGAGMLRLRAGLAAVGEGS